MSKVKVCSFDQVQVKKNKKRNTRKEKQRNRLRVNLPLVTKVGTHAKFGANLGILRPEGFSSKSLVDSFTFISYI